MAGHSTLEDFERTNEMKRFARGLLEQGLSRDVVRKECAKRFNISQRKVSIRLKKYGVDVRNVSAAQRASWMTSISKLSDDKKARLVADAREMVRRKVDGDTIRETLAERYGVRGQSIVRHLNLIGVFIHAEDQIKTEHDSFISPDSIFDKAARKVGARFDHRRGVYFIGREPITGIRLVERAGMELPQ